MQEGLDDFEKRGVQVVAIGQGTGEQAAQFAEKWGVAIPILGDVRGAAYQAFGMLRGSWWTVVVRSLLTDPVETVRLIGQADMKGAALPAADVLRLPGVAIIEQGGRMRFLHKARETSDFPSNTTMLAAVDAL